MSLKDIKARWQALQYAATITQLAGSALKHSNNRQICYWLKEVNEEGRDIAQRVESILNHLDINVKVKESFNTDVDVGYTEFMIVVKV